MIYLLLFVVALWAGVQNALAGGGTFITFPVLLMAGLDARAANITSTIALFPGQVTTALAGRSQVAGNAHLSIRELVVISLIGGVAGAGLLLMTPSHFFERIVPFLVLVATGIFAWGSFRPRSEEAPVHLSRGALMGSQFAIAVYGGYFGGGIGILMLAALTAAGWEFRSAGATKNLLAGVMNFVLGPSLHAWQATRRELGRCRSTCRRLDHRRASRRLSSRAHQRDAASHFRHRHRRCPDHRTFHSRVLTLPRNKTEPVRRGCLARAHSAP